MANRHLNLNVSPNKLLTFLPEEEDCIAWQSRTVNRKLYLDETCYRLLCALGVGRRVRHIVNLHGR